MAKSALFQNSPYAHHVPELIEYEGKPAVRVRCLKCGTPVVLNFGAMTREQAVEKLGLMTDMPLECPGYHVELSGWDLYWRFADAIALRYPEPAEIVPIAHPTTARAA